MKNRILTIITALVILPFLHSCEETEDVRQPVSFDSWENGATLKFSPVKQADGTTPVAFEYEIDAKNAANNSWARTELNYDLSFLSNVGDASDISKIDLYAFIEEKIGDGYNYLGGNTGKLIITITNPTGATAFKLTKDQLYDLFKNDFSTTRTDLATDDFIEIKWVITGKDGNVIDTRTNCTGFNCSFGVKTDVTLLDPTWIGDFQYNWTYVSPATITYSWAKVGANPTGTVTFSPSKTVKGAFNISDLSCGGAYGDAATGYVIYDKAKTELSVYNTTSDACKWELVSRTNTTLTINWTYRYTASYGEFGTFQIIRNDGINWPANLKIANK